MNEQEFAELSAGHALGALSPSDELAYRAALAEHPEWAPIADADRETAAVLGDAVESVAPPLALRSQLLSRMRQGDAEAAPQVPAFSPVDAAPPVPAFSPVDAAPPAAVVPPVPAVPASVAAEAAADTAADSALDTVAMVRDVPAPSTEVVQTIQRRTWTRGLFALVASMALLVGIGWGVGALADRLTTPPAVTALAQIEAAPDARSAVGKVTGGGEATVHWSDSLGQAVLVTDGLPAIADDRTYELWFVRGDGAVSAGTFAASDDTTTALLTGTVEQGDTIALTVEQAGGSPGGAPTTDPILMIATES